MPRYKILEKKERSKRKKRSFDFKLNPLGKTTQKAIESTLDEFDKIDGRLSLVWNLWKYRMGRFLVPNCVGHFKSIVSLLFYVMQVVVLLNMINKRRGHIGGIPSLQTSLFPIYTMIVIRLVLQLSVLCWTIHKALHIERNYRFTNAFEELHRFMPVFEHAIPVVAYTLMLLSSIALGFCHLNTSQSGVHERVENIFCATFDMHLLKGVIIFFVVMQTLHYLIGIYHNKRHTSIPKRSWTRQESQTEIMDKFDEVNEELTGYWQWWEHRMDRLFSAHISHNISNLLDAILEGATLVLVIEAIVVSHGDLSKVGNFPTLFIPLYMKFFGKAGVQLLTLLYVTMVIFKREDQRAILKHLREPGKGLKSLEHLIPILTYLLIGFVTMSIANCHLNTEKDTGQKICEILPFSTIQAIILVAAAVQMIHHILSIYHYQRHASKGERKDNQESEEDFHRDVLANENSVFF